MLAVLVAVQCRSLASQSANSTTARQQPTLDFFPKSKTSKERTLIWLKSRSKDNYLEWYNNTLESLKVYYNPGVTKTSYLKVCTYTGGPYDETDLCDIDPKDWGLCHKDSHFYYDQGSPCIFLMLDKMHGWKPEVYDDPAALPADMPKLLKEHIGKITEPERRKNIWITCEGETAADKENLGPVMYYPEIQGFPAFYFPHSKKLPEGYLSPLLAIRLTRPANGIVLNIECRAWAKNIKYDKADGLGYVHFELLID